MRRTARRTFIGSVTATVLLLSAPCVSSAESDSESAREPGTWGVDLTAMDKSVDPGDDFYRYVNGTWLKHATLPKGLPVAGAAITVTLNAEAQQKAIVADLLKGKYAPDSTEGQIIALYKGFLDEKTRSERGLTPIKADIDAAMAAKSRSDLARLMSKDVYPTVVSIGVELDPGNPARYLVTFTQSGLVLGEKEFYLEQKEPFISIRKAYKTHIETMLKLAGIDDAASRANAILAFETELAKGFWTKAERRDPVRMYHLMTLEQFMSYAPSMDWKGRLDEAGYTEVREVNVRTDSAVANAAKVFNETPLDTLRAYMAYRLINGNAPFLSPEIEKASFEFSGGVLQGLKEQRAIEDRALGNINLVFGEGLGKLYTERYLQPDSRADVAQMFKFMRAAFREKFASNPWMDAPTRAEATAKLDKTGEEIGAPSRYHDYSSLSFSQDDFFGNLRKIAQWNTNDSAAKLHEPHRTWEWYHYPQDVNAYFAPLDNEVVVLTGIMQPPFLDPNADPAVNFGSMAAVIGHEFGHGFDDQGSQYDGIGKLRNWWTTASREAFNKRGDMLVAQYEQYAVVPGANLNGRLTLGENLGDLGGITVAYAAYRRFVDAEQGGKAPVIDGYTGDERFFMAYAQLWAMFATPEYWKRAALSDPHSPGEFRVNGVLRNFDPWYETYKVTTEDKLYLPPEQRVRLW